MLQMDTPGVPQPPPSQQLLVMRRERDAARENSNSLKAELDQSRELIRQLEHKGDTLHSQYFASETSKSVTSKVCHLLVCYPYAMRFCSIMHVCS